MISIDNSYVKVIQKTYLNKIEKQRTNALEKLNALYLKKTAGQEKDYLENVINLFTNNPDILTWDLKKIKNEKKLFPDVPTEIRKVRGKDKVFKLEIKNEIIDCLGYKNLRNSFYPKYFNDIGIKACVYCNSQLTITTDKKKAKFDVDHFHSKDDYPFLSISLFNLYPACASCNRLKSTKKVEFELYTDNISKTQKSEYGFKLNSDAKSRYLSTRDKNTIEFTFNEPVYSSIEYEKFNNLFHIEGIYKTQLDLIEELIIKSQIYNPSYLKSLKNNFGKLNLHQELFKRMLVGNYTEDKDIHKRPMSKLVMDVAKELGLIK